MEEKRMIWDVPYGIDLDELQQGAATFNVKRTMWTTFLLTKTLQEPQRHCLEKHALFTFWGSLSQIFLILNDKISNMSDKIQ